MLRLQFLEDQYGYTGNPNSMSNYISAISFGGLTFDPEVGAQCLAGERVS
jgi:hypothetical protein